MKLFKLSGVLAVFLLFTSFTNNNFWGKTGHRATGEIAEKHLTKRAKKKIEKILQGESLALTSTFADEIKSDRRYDKFYSWHYVNMSFNENYEKSHKNPKGDLITGISHCISVLKDNSQTAEEKRFYLKLLVHFMGDLHQPLHVGRKEDKGGNTIQLRWFDEETNLHKVWDENLIEAWNMSYKELADNTKKLSKKEVKELQKGTMIDWLHDTHKLTKEIYNSVELGTQLKYKYSYDYLPVVRTQLQKGGIRLAKVLNDIYS